MFQRNILPPSLGSKSKPSKKPVLEKVASNGLHSTVSQKIELFCSSKSVSAVVDFICSLWISVPVRYAKSQPQRNYLENMSVVQVKPIWGLFYGKVDIKIVWSSLCGQWGRHPLICWSKWLPSKKKFQGCSWNHFTTITLTSSSNPFTLSWMGQTHGSQIVTLLCSMGDGPTHPYPRQSGPHGDEHSYAAWWHPSSAFQDALSWCW
jgi:hypothetical protein